MGVERIGVERMRVERMGVGRMSHLEKSASWAPWEKSRSRWVRFGHLWTQVSLGV